MFGRNLREILVLVSISLLGISGTATGQIIYVDTDANGANDGSSWANAYKYLQDALAEAESNLDVNEIRVGQGIYKPDQNSVYPDGTGVREATFQLVNGVCLKGGYAGFGEPEPNERAINRYKTILSGDLGGNDGADFGHYSENNYHVVMGSGTDESAILNGVTITGGHADGDGAAGLGAGMYSYGGSATIVDCNFTWNLAKNGGGVYSRSGNLKMVGCRFASNSAHTNGGGMYTYKSRPVLTNCTFSYNSCCYFGFCFWRCTGAGLYNNDSNSTVIDCTFNGNWLGSMHSNRGGGVYSYKGYLTLKNCVFGENRAESVFGSGFETDYAGGGVFILGVVNAKVLDCIFSGNSANTGGGIFNNSLTVEMRNCTFIENSANYFHGGAVYSTGSPTLTACGFSNNWADMDGGGVYNSSGSSPTVSNCTFTNNQAGYNGGGMCNYWSRGSEAINCTFSGNSAERAGGGMYNESFNPNLVNCTFSGNSAGNNGAAVYNKYIGGGISATLTNCILWGDRPEEIGLYDDHIGLPLVTYCDVEGGWDGQGNIDADPCFVEVGYRDANDVWVDGDYHLPGGSPCIDRGDNDGVPADSGDIDGDGNTTEAIPWDLDGKFRIILGRVDMGAYEFNRIPVADAGPNQVAYAWIDGIAEVTLDGGGSYDPDGQPLGYLWSWTIDGNTITEISGDGDEMINLADFVVLAGRYPRLENVLLNLSVMAEAWLTTPSSAKWNGQCDIGPTGAIVTIELPIGEHVIELTVDDGADGSALDCVAVNVAAALEADMWMWPKWINRSGCWPRNVLAVMTLPEGVEEDEIKDEKFVLYPGENEDGIEAGFQYVYSRHGRVKAIALFDKAELMDAVAENGWVELNVVGELESGQYFYGSDSVKIIDWHW